MVNYLKLGFGTNENYLDEFFETLLGSNRTYGYYVDWQKVFNNLQSSLIEINILNSLNKVPEEELKTKFREIITNYPEVVPILPSILAIRDKKVPVFDLDEKDFKNVYFSKTKFKIDEVIEFAIKTGL